MPRKRGRSKTRSKHRLPVAEVNVVTLMDVLTTLLFFLLLASSLTKFNVLQATSLPSSSTSQADPKPVFSLQVLIESPKKLSVFLGPIEKLNVQNRKGLTQHLSKSYRGSERVGFVRVFKGNSLKNLLSRAQRDLIHIKKSFPSESKAVLAVSDRVRYQQLVDSIASLRSLGSKSKGFQLTNALGKTEKTTILFPEVIIAESDPDRKIAGGGA